MRMLCLISPSPITRSSKLHYVKLPSIHHRTAINIRGQVHPFVQFKVFLLTAPCTWMSMSKQTFFLILASPAVLTDTCVDNRTPETLFGTRTVIGDAMNGDFWFDVIGSRNLRLLGFTARQFSSSPPAAQGLPWPWLTTSEKKGKETDLAMPSTRWQEGTKTPGSALRCIRSRRDQSRSWLRLGSAAN